MLWATCCGFLISDLYSFLGNKHSHTEWLDIVIIERRLQINDIRKIAGGLGQFARGFPLILLIKIGYL